MEQCAVSFSVQFAMAAVCWFVMPFLAGAARSACDMTQKQEENYLVKASSRSRMVEMLLSLLGYQSVSYKFKMALLSTHLFASFQRSESNFILSNNDSNLARPPNSSAGARAHPNSRVAQALFGILTHPTFQINIFYVLTFALTSSAFSTGRCRRPVCSQPSAAPPSPPCPARPTDAAPP